MHSRLAAALAPALLFAVLLAVATGDETLSPALLPLLGVVPALAWLGARRRRWRMPSALALGVLALALVAGAGLGARGEAERTGAALGVLGALVPVALLWPRRTASSVAARLPGLSFDWVLLATLVALAADVFVLTLPPRGPRVADHFLLETGFFALGLFLTLCAASHLGRFRWLVLVPGAALLCAFGAEFPRESRVDEVPLVFGGATVAFLLGFDWIRAARTGRGRMLRGFAIAATGALVPAAFGEPGLLGLEARAAAIVTLRALALGLVAGLAPRVGGARSLPVQGVAVGAPPGLLLPGLLGVAGVATGLALFQREGAAAFAIVVATAIVAFMTSLRLRLMRAGLLGGGLLVAAVLASAAEPLDLDRWQPAAGFWASLVGIFLWSGLLLQPALHRHFVRRARGGFVPTPRASFALAVAALVSPVVGLRLLAPEHVLARVGGPIPLGAPLLYTPPSLDGVPALPRHVGAAALAAGKTVLVVDPERSALHRLSLEEGAKPRSVQVSSWPAQLVVDRGGLAYVSTRGGGTIDVVETETLARIRSVDLGSEVLGLALHPDERLLYAAMPSARQVVALSLPGLEVRHALQLPVEPRLLAVTPSGLAIAADEGEHLYRAGFSLDSLRTVTLARGTDPSRRAWHTQGLLAFGDDLVVVHARVDTGLEVVSAQGGYGGGQRQPIELVASIVRGDRLVPVPATEAERTLPFPELTAFAVHQGRVLVASRGVGQVMALGRERLVTPELDPTVLAQEVSGAAAVGVLDDGRAWWFDAFARTVTLEGGETHALPAVGKRTSPQLALGRALFHRLGRTEISDSGLGCVSCHVDGGDDGLVWRLQGARLQTPSLAGRLADTAPFNWHGTETTLEANVKQTVRRLGGTGLSEREVKALARFLREGLPVPRRPEVATSPLVARGEALFFDRKVGCSSCHRPDRGFTDGERHDVSSVSDAESEELARAEAERREEIEGVLTARPVTDAREGLDTPSLRDVALTAPYFHDGSRPTLMAVLTQNHDQMGRTSHLAEDELRALVAYLETL